MTARTGLKLEPGSVVVIAAVVLEIEPDTEPRSQALVKPIVWPPGAGQSGFWVDAQDVEVIDPLDPVLGGFRARTVHSYRVSMGMAVEESPVVPVGLGVAAELAALKAQRDALVGLLEGCSRIPIKWPDWSITRAPEGWRVWYCCSDPWYQVAARRGLAENPPVIAIAEDHCRYFPSFAEAYAAFPEAKRIVDEANEAFFGRKE